jgi:ABC-type phosphate/phosphonate transport system permease subunit
MEEVEHARMRFAHTAILPVSSPLCIPIPPRYSSLCYCRLQSVFTALIIVVVAAVASTAAAVVVLLLLAAACCCCRCLL